MQRAARIGLKSLLLLIGGVVLSGAMALHAADSCLHDDPKEPAVEIPLKRAIGNQAFDEAMASGLYRYVGSSKCRLCHRQFFLGRKKDLHDFAMETLAEAKAQDNPKCLICHSTGFGVETGFESIEKTPRLVNVQCEGCHGPGNVHIANAKQKRKGGFLAGADRPERLKKMCTSCHTRKWDGDLHRFESDYRAYRSAEPTYGEQ